MGLTKNNKQEDFFFQFFSIFCGIYRYAMTVRQLQRVVFNNFPDLPRAS